MHAAYLRYWNSAWYWAWNCNIDCSHFARYSNSGQVQVAVGN